MLDFYADWCVSCKEMERYTFSDPKVIAALTDAVLLQADVTANDEQDVALLQATSACRDHPVSCSMAGTGKNAKAIAWSALWDPMSFPAM